MPRPERNLRRMAQLLALYYRLPHVVLTRKRENLEQFEAFVKGDCSDCSSEAALDGFRHAWRSGDLEAIATTAARLAKDRLASEPLLATFADVARRALERRSKTC